MTDIDKRRLINPVDNGSSDNHGVLPATYDHNGQPDGKSNKKKYAIIGGIIALLAILGLVLGLTLGGGSDPVNPDVPPTPGPVEDGYNPYHVDPDSIVDEQSRKSGIITTGNAQPSSYELFSRDGSKGNRRF